MVSTLYTAGYEGQSVESFLDLLKEHSVECLFDVRQMPLSRKKGFSKTALRSHLERNHIKYIHFRELGSPKEIRDKLKETKDYEDFFAAMENHLSGAEDAIEEACRMAAEKVSCLLCFEKYPEQCHRSLVALKIKERNGNGLTINNL